MIIWFWFSVQLTDDVARLVLIKTPRKFSPTVRAALSLLTSLPISNDNNSSKDNTNGSVMTVPVTVSVVGEHGSLRTAKRDMIAKLRYAYREHLLQENNTSKSTPTTTSKETKRIVQSLQNGLNELHAIDF